jgi:Autographiviridae endonuclease VII
MGAPHIEKKCADCWLIKSVSEFYRDGKERDRYCRSCRRVRDRRRSAQKQRRRYDAEKRRDYKLQRLYGITLAEYDRLFAAQSGCCVICGAEETRRMYGERPKLVVDHNHITGAVRGLLCCACNGRLAAIEDEQFMLLAKEYIRNRDGYSFVGDAE